MVYCTRCGAKNEDQAKVCVHCGASLEAAGTAYRRQREECFGREGDPMGMVSFGVFLTVVAVTWLKYPNVGSQIVDYFQSFSIYGRPVMPPPSLCQPIIFFLTLLGFWQVILAGMRMFTRGGPRRALSDAVTGLFLLYIAFILMEYSKGAIKGGLVMPLIIVGLGALILLTAFLRLLLPRKPEGR